MKTYLSTLFFLLISLFNMNAMIKIYEAVPSEDSPYAGREIYLMPTLHHRKLGELSDNTINFLIEVNKADGHVIYEGGSGPGNEEWVEKLMEFGVEDQVAYAEFCQKPFIKEVIETYLDKYEDMTEEQIKVSPICLLFAKHYVAKDKIYQGEAFDVKLVDFFREKNLKLENFLESLYCFLNESSHDKKIPLSHYENLLTDDLSALKESIKQIDDAYTSSDLLTLSLPDFLDKIAPKADTRQKKEYRTEDDFIFHYRNKQWIQKLPNLFAQIPEHGPVLIAAGAGHFMKNKGMGLFEYFQSQGCELRLMEPCYDSLS